LEKTRPEKLAEEIQKYLIKAITSNSYDVENTRPESKISSRETIWVIDIEMSKNSVDNFVGILY
jgi:hypothetical protein